MLYRLEEAKAETSVKLRTKRSEQSYNCVINNCTTQHHQFLRKACVTQISPLRSLVQWSPVVGRGKLSYQRSVSVASDNALQAKKKQKFIGMNDHTPLSLSRPGATAKEDSSSSRHIKTHKEASLPIGVVGGGRRKRKSDADRCAPLDAN